MSEMGQTYHAYSLTAPARECYENASRLAPKDFRWIYLLAKLDQQEGRVEEAVRHFQIAGALQPSFVAVPVNLGNIYLELNRLEDARASFIKALEIQQSAANVTSVNSASLTLRGVRWGRSQLVYT